MFEKLLNVVTEIVLIFAVGYMAMHIIAAARVDFWFVFGLALIITFGVPALCRFVYRAMH